MADLMITRPVRHKAPMTLGANGTFGCGPTLTACGLLIEDSSIAPFVPHSNLRLHTTCPDCLAFMDFEPLTDRSMEAVEAWLAV